MSFLDSVKSFFGGEVEGKIVELFTNLVGTIKPLIENGKLSDAVKDATADFGDLGDKLKDVLAKLSGASAEAKTDLVKEKDDIMASVKEKGGALLSALEKESAALPDELKGLVSKAKALIEKL